MNSLSRLEVKWKQQTIKKHSFMLFVRGWLCLIILGMVQCLSAQPISFTARLNAKQVLMDEHFEVSFTFAKPDNANFNPPTFDKDFIQISGPSRSLNTSIVNGVLSREETVRYVLKPRKAGIFFIEPALLKIGEEVFETVPLEIEVLEKMIVPDSLLEKIFIRAIPSTTEVYVGQQIIVDYKLYTTLQVERLDILEEPTFQGFYAKEVRYYSGKSIQEVIDGVTYYTKVVRRNALFPKYAGEWTIDELILTVGVDTSKNENRPSFFFNSKLMNVDIKSNGLTFQISDYPKPSPIDFKGGVDCYDISCTHIDSFDRCIPLQIEIGIRSRGDINRIMIPRVFDDYSAPLYQIRDDSWEKGGIFHAERKFLFSIFPDELDSLRLNPSIVFFNTETHKYDTLERYFAIPVDSFEQKTIPVDKHEPGTEEALQDEEDYLDLVFVIDVSGSMLAQDFTPDRLNFIRQTLIDELTSQPDKLRIGVVIFSGYAMALCPLTLDYFKVNETLNKIKVGIVKEDGTAQGMGILAAVNMLFHSQSKSKSIVLITDGMNNRGYVNPLEAAYLASTSNIKLFTISIGTEGEALTPVGIRTDGSYVYDMAKVTLDESSLKQMAEITGASHFSFKTEKVEELGIVMDELEYLLKMPPTINLSSVPTPLAKQTARSMKYLFDVMNMENIKWQGGDFELKPMPVPNPGPDTTE